jgi:hypothetical protein
MHHRQERLSSPFANAYRGSVATLLLSAVAAAAAVTTVGACLDRPVGQIEPRTSNAFSERLSATRVDKIDLLFMIDNSASMADKQAILAEAIPDLVNRLVRPSCVATTVVDGVSTTSTPVPPNADGSCPAGLVAELQAIDDIHIGVITSSLGGHGADACVPATTGDLAHAAEVDDHAHLLTRTDVTGVQATTWDGTAGFFQWDPEGKQSPPGEADVGSLVAAFGSVVRGAGQAGCGYEASLEAFYRFLIDPNPPLTVGRPAALGGPVATAGIDDDLLQQRAEFLRPDSLVAVVVLSDENDCSTADTILPATLTRRSDDGTEGPAEGWDLSANAEYPANYLMAQQLNGKVRFPQRSGTSACVDPSSPACTDCFRSNNTGPGCRELPAAEDSPELRCWDQKRRFGVDMLYPVQRYVDGLREAKVFDLRDPRSAADLAAGVPRPPAPLVDNPLYQDLPYLRYHALERALAEESIDQATFDAKTKRLGNAGKRPPFAARGNDAVFFAGIVGVPWQDIARKKDDLTQGYAIAAEVKWERLRTTDGVPPTDPLMREANTPRSGVHPVTGETIGLTSNNAINGHEWSSEGADLMYACRLPLPEPRSCVGARNCECDYELDPTKPDPIGTQARADAAHNPLCQKDAASPFGTTQHWARAYPGSRFVEVMHRFQSGSIIASICTPNLEDKARSDYGYRPAVGAIIDRLKNQLSNKCTPRKLAVEPDGKTPCLVIDARLPSLPASGEAPAFVPEAADVAACRACDRPGRKPLAASSNIETLLRRNADVAAYGCLCEVEQLTGASRDACVVGDTSVGPGADVQGWCYVDNSAAGADDQSPLTKSCATHTTVQLATETNQSTFFITCLGASLSGETTP